MLGPMTGTRIDGWPPPAGKEVTTMGVLFALLSALSYGLSDFVGGLVTRRTSPWATAAVGSGSAGVLLAAVAPFWDGHPTSSALLWGALAGLGGGTGAGFLYRGFAAGRMGVVGPVSSVGAALVPLAAGLAGGDRPPLLAWVGIAVAFPGIWLVARETAVPQLEDPDPTTPDGVDDVDGVDGVGGVEAAAPGKPATVTAAGVVDGLLAGLGFGLLFAALGQVPASAGLWPLSLAQAVTVPATIVLATVLREEWRPRGRASLQALWCGLLSAIATPAFLLAAHEGYLAIAGVLASLYPAFTILLAATLLREPVHRTQGVGLVLCGICVTCVALA